jgi:hypothetical protein
LIEKYRIADSIDPDRYIDPNVRFEGRVGTPLLCALKYAGSSGCGKAEKVVEMLLDAYAEQLDLSIMEEGKGGRSVWKLSPSARVTVKLQEVEERQERIQAGLPACEDEDPDD